MICFICVNITILKKQCQLCKKHFGVFEYYIYFLRKFSIKKTVPQI